MSFFTESWMVLALVILLSMIITRTALVRGIRFAQHYKLIDVPSERKRHAKPTPMHGGVAIFLGLFAAGFAFSTPSLLLAGLVLLIMGMLDDAQPRPAWLRLVVQVLAASIVVMQGISITSLGQLFGDQPFILSHTGQWFSIVAIVGCINAFNMLDGCDGLAAMMGVVCLSALCLISGVCPIDYGLMLPLLVCFLWDNFRWVKKRPARVFLGDSGSMLLGLWVAACAIQLSQLPWVDMGQDVAMTSWLTPVSVLWCLALPLFDVGQVMIRRVLARQSPLSPDRQHLHCALIDRGFGLYKTVMLMILIQLLLVVLATMALFLGMSEAELFLCFLIASVTYFVIVGRVLARKELTT